MIISVGKEGVSSYTHGWLKNMAQWSGIDKEDIELVSICDPDEFYLALRPQTTKWRVIGGSESFYEQMYINFADAVCVGEGFQFFKDYKKHKNILKVFEQPYMFTREKNEVVASDIVDWNLCPLIRVGPKKIMTLGSRGCKNKCKFCFTSWTTKNQIRPPLNFYKKGYTFNYISNDHIGSEKVKATVKSMTVKQYLNLTYTEAKSARVYRFGIEGFREDTRKWLGKPIDDLAIKNALHIAKKMNHQIVLFFIFGIEEKEDIERFVEYIGYDLSMQPRIMMKGTYFAPDLHTPLQGYDIRRIKQINKEWLYGKLKSFTPRWKLNLRADMGYRLWRAAFHRLTEKDEIVNFWKLRNKNASEVFKYIETNSLNKVYDTPANTSVVFSWRKSFVS